MSSVAADVAVPAHTDTEDTATVAVAPELQGVYLCSRTRIARFFRESFKSGW